MPITEAQQNALIAASRNVLDSWTDAEAVAYLKQFAPGVDDDYLRGYFTPRVFIGPPAPPPLAWATAIPDWLHQFLMAFNFTILTWDIRAGDAIETALSWAVGLIDGARGLAQSALDLAQSAWDHTTEAIVAALMGPMADITALWTWTSTLYDQVNAWWDGKRYDVLAWIDAALVAALAEVSRFLSVDMFLAWWGHIGTSFDSWWEAARAGVLEAEQARRLVDTADVVEVDGKIGG